MKMRMMQLRRSHFRLRASLRVGTWINHQGRFRESVSSSPDEQFFRSGIPEGLSKIPEDLQTVFLSEPLLLRVSTPFSCPEG